MALHPTFCLYEMDPQSIVAVAWLKDFKKTNFKIINEDLFCQFCFGFDYNFEFEPDFKCVLRSNILIFFSKWVPSLRDGSYVYSILYIHSP